MRVQILILQLLAVLAPAVYSRRPRSSTITANDLVQENCVEEYNKLGRQTEPVRVQKTLRVLEANRTFTAEATHLQVPGYDGEGPLTRRKKRSRSARHIKKNKIHTRQPSEDMTFYYGYVTPSGVTASTGTPENYYNRVERTEILYRVTKGLKEMSICELETYYVRRYNKFPFFVKSVTCQKNRALKGDIICNSRYEKGHILRLVKAECMPEGEGGKWEHDWETRVVGCDAVLPVSRIVS
ncbi:uncharacterized protein LOC134825122 [Bolinopsis microptera]|uniref:uncharacterized protein LOC134825122 n=1 Tax=Bolinopsis microptera TaxID=2820187 RepID=UPI003079D659